MTQPNLGRLRVPDLSDTNESEHEPSPRNQKTARKLHGKFPKGDVRHWLARVKREDSSDYGVQILFRGRRHRFPLKTSNKETAAAKARTIYLSLVANGWVAVLAEHKPQTTKRAKSATICALCTEVAATSSIRPGTLTSYMQCLRQIAATIAGVGDQPTLDEHGQPKKDAKGRIILKKRFDYRSGGRDAWLEKVNALTLDILTSEAIQRWMLAYVAKAGNAPDARRRAENSAASLIRNARSLFSEKALQFAKANLLLPTPLPFAGIKLPKKGNTKYQSKIDAQTLIAAAMAELDGAPLQIFTLAMLCGLRRREIDLLTWEQVDFSTAQIRLERTEYFEPKSEDSIGTVDVDPELMALLRGWRAQSNGPFVVQSTRPPRHHNSRTNYRCQPAFESLNEWLRGKGITANKPLHELRKELGALLASEQGIFAAQAVLRHAQISTTAAYYTDKKRRISAGLGALLHTNVPTIEFCSSKPEQIDDGRRSMGFGHS